jgi:hypothetical protein
MKWQQDNIPGFIIFLMQDEVTKGQHTKIYNISNAEWSDNRTTY